MSDCIVFVEQAIQDIRDGKMVINEGDLYCAADRVTPEMINFMATYTSDITPDIHSIALIKGDINRVGGGLTPSVLSHHRTYGSVYGGS